MVWTIGVMMSKQKQRWPLLLLAFACLLWTVWVWYAKYLECDDRLRDLGVRFELGRLERCTLPGRSFEVFEWFWMFGALVFVVGLIVIRKTGSKRTTA